MRIPLLAPLAGTLLFLTGAIRPTIALAQAAPVATPPLDAKAQKQQRLAESANFFAQLKTNKHVVKTFSGLRYEILRQGTGIYPRPSDVVRVNYTGTLIDGTVFDSSLRPRHPGAAPQPVEFELDQVIEGWTEGIQRISKGGKIRLYIPANLAYGDQVEPNIPPGSTLIFEVELLGIRRP
jgi:FKBP-type peptidyl-prolyl cis-trans isomerase